VELSQAIRETVVAARGIKRHVGRVVQRLHDTTRFAIPSENEFLRGLGGKFGTIQEVLAAASRETGRLFVVDIPREGAAAFFAERHPGRRRRILEWADRVCAHRFDLLGSGPVDLGPCLPWHADFTSGKVWDRGVHFKDLRTRVEEEFGRGWDVKVPWELSRFQHLPALGQAFWLSADRRYFDEFRAEVLDWIRQNRPAFGINWSCTMDVAIRAVSWVWAYGFFRPEILADGEFASIFLRSLFAHGRFIASNLEDGAEISSNHYFADLVGLLFLGVLFRGAPEPDAWKGMAISEIVKENGRQTYADGVDYEASTAYHRLMSEMALTALLLAERSGFRLGDLRGRVRGMIDFIAHYTKPDGLAPQIGDNDDGRLQILGEYGADRRDHRHLLAVAACAFEDEALLALAGERWEEAFWFFGAAFAERQEAARRRPSCVAVTGRAYPQGGVAILRHEDLYAVLDAGPVGLRGHGAHAHNDTLSVEIHAAGEDLILDPGTGHYTRDLQLRDRFRATAAHNTVRVDGEEINLLPGRPFELPGGDAPGIRRFVSRAGFDLVEAEHRGYMRLPDPVLHRRILLLNKRTRRFVIEDHLAGAGRHRLEVFFHLAPRCDAHLEGGVVRCRIGHARFAIRPVLLPEGTLASLEEDLYSPSYGRVERSRTARFEWTGTLPTVLRFAIELPRGSEDGA
jgi:heparinase II/III-like protein